MPTNNTSSDFQLWFAAAGGGEALVFVSGDAGVGGGNTAIALTYILQGDPSLFAPRDIMLDTVHDRFFFVDSDVSGGHNRIIQGSISQVLANPGSPALTILYQDTGTTSAASLRALVLDPDNSLIYFDHGTTFAKISYDTALQTPTVLANLGANNFITQIAIDFATGEVFLASSRVQSFFGQDIVEDNFIYRASGLTPASASLSFAKLPFSPDDTAFGDPDVPPVPGNAFPQELGVIRGLDYDPVTHTLYISTASVALDTSTDQDGSEITTYYGGVFSYSTTGNPSGTYTTIYQQDGVTGPTGLLGFIEVDPSTGRYFVVDTTGGPAAGDGGVYVGSLSGGTPTLFATIGNPGDLVPQGIDILHAPTLAGTETGATATETAGVGSGFSNEAQPFASITAGDLDSATFADQLAGAQVRISAGFNSAPGSSEQLTINGTTSGTLGSGINYSYNSLTGVMTLTGINSFDNYEAALQLVSYSIDGDNPDANGAAPTRTISFSIHDGLLVSDEFDTIVNVAGTNDAPVNTTGGAVATSEDSASVAVAGLSVSDADNGSLTVTLSVGRGTLAIDTGVPGGVTAGQVTGNGTGTVTFSGTQSEINTTLAAATGVAYTPTPNVNGPDTLTMTSDDGTAQDVDLVPIGVAAVNDAPTVAGDGTEDADPIEENMPSPVGETVASLFGGQFSDATDQVAGGSSANAFAGVAVTANGSSLASGQWQYFNGAVWVDIGPASDGSAVLLAATTAIRFNPAAGFTGAAPTLTVHLVDDSGGALASGTSADLSVTGGTTAYSTGTVVLSQQVENVNDPPTGVTGTLEAPEDAVNGSAAGTVVGQDPDSSSFTYALLDDAGGRFDMDSAGNVTVADGLLLDYEQASSHTIRVRVTDDQGAYDDFDMNVSVIDVLGEDVVGDGRDNTFWGGAENDSLRGGDGNDTLRGGGGQDALVGDAGNDMLFGDGGDDYLAGGDGNDILNGGAGVDVLRGNGGEDVFVFHKGEADGDTIIDFWGQGAAIEDSIVLEGYAAGTTLTRIGNGNSVIFEINDHGFIEIITIHRTGQVHTTDWGVVP